MRIDVLTLFPEMFTGVLGSSILKRAAEPVADPADPHDQAKVRPPVVSYHLHNIRDHSHSKHRKVDQPPFGGGPGMVLQCQPVWDAVRHAQSQDPDRPPTRILLTPKGRPFTQPMAERLARRGRLLLIAGHYEDLDQRVIDRLHELPAPPDADAGEDGLLEVSMGDYVLSGGELPAMTLIDAVVRLLPGALGHDESAHHDSFSAGAGRMLDCPHYTRPQTWDGREVPAVLRSGDHAKIAAWRSEQSRKLTAERRPEMLGPRPGAGLAFTVAIREQRPDDAQAIAEMLGLAFGPDGQEVQIAAAITEQAEAILADVAETEQTVVGHALWSPMRLAGSPSAIGLLGLAPLAVHPAYQGRGIGSALMRHGIAQARQAGATALFVLGDPAYYHRFGFQPAEALGYTNPYGFGEPFMALALKDPLPPHQIGEVRYCQAVEGFMRGGRSSGV